MKQFPTGSERLLFFSGRFLVFDRLFFIIGVRPIFLGAPSHFYEGRKFILIVSKGNDYNLC